MARGSILTRQNKDGSTSTYIKFRTEDGTQVKRKVAGGRREAERELRDALSAVDRGALRTVSEHALGEAATAWLERTRPRLEASTHRDYEAHVRLRLVPAFGALRLRDVSRARIEAYLTASTSGAR